MKTNVLYYGDNLDILRHHIPDNSIDLIYLDQNPPTKDMITDAATSGFYENDFWKKKYPRVQIITVLDVLKGKRPEMRWGGSPFAKASTEKEKAEQEALFVRARIVLRHTVMPTANGWDDGS